MNIFVISDCPNECAQALDDLRLNKMIIETAQLLSTAARAHGYTGDALYKTTHINHPCTVWARETSANYQWLLNYFSALLNERYFRHGKGHASARLLQLLNIEHFRIPDGERTPFANCSLYKDATDTHQAYKETMREKWVNDKRPPQWKKRGRPVWT